MRRITSNELLDEDRGTAEEIRTSLDDLWRINRHLGGVTSSLRLLDHFFSRAGPHPVRVLDVGSGDTRLAARLKEELLRRKIPAEFFVLDRRITHLDAGRPFAPGLRPVVADVFALPFLENSFDLVTCNLFLHHFSGEQAQFLLRCLARVAREAVLIDDLERHLLPYIFIRLAMPFTRSRITRNDGPASVRQAYTREELAEMATCAGFREFEAERIPPFRLGLTIWK